MRQMTGESEMGNAVSTTEGVADIDFGDGVTEEQINAAIDSGDPDAIEALLRGELPEEFKDTPKTEEQTAVQAAPKQDEESATSGAESQEQSETTEAVVTETEERAPISGKSGKSTIPYAVLENTRHERNELRNKVHELESKNQQVNQFLAKRGIKFEDVTAEQAESLTQEEMAQLEEIDPLVGKAFRVLTNSTAKANEAPPATETPVLAAIRQNADLNSWRESDPDRWELAIAIDDTLLKDPKFSSLPLSERFAEAARRTKAAFGDVAEVAPAEPKQNIEQIAAQKVAEATKASVPRSLTNIGVTPSTERPLVERLAEMTQEEIAVAMQSMSQDQIDQVLSAIS